MKIPVITIDGPGGTGKGTVTLMLAHHLGWHFLDSGAIYRALAWAILHYQISLDDEPALQNMLNQTNIEFKNEIDGEITKILCDGFDITTEIRQENCAMMASTASAVPLVRAALLQHQRNFRRSPGLVTDGRDMGTVVFPDATAKFFLTATLAERARRRYKQLHVKGIDVSLREIQADLEKRDKQDSLRAISPTQPAADAIIIDTTYLNVAEVFDKILEYLKVKSLSS